MTASLLLTCDTGNIYVRSCRESSLGFWGFMLLSVGRVYRETMSNGVS